LLFFKKWEDYSKRGRIDMAKIPANMTELNGYIPKDLKRRFKSLCVDADRSMSDVLVVLIEGWIAEQEAQKNNPSVRKAKGEKNDEDDE
jgi:N-acetylglutamate synthase/N-acetylornithine aminotransferase